MLEGLQMGMIEMAAITTGTFPTVYPKIMVLDLPYLFSKSEVAWKVLDGPFGDKIREDFCTRLELIYWRLVKMDTGTLPTQKSD